MALPSDGNRGTSPPLRACWWACRTPPERGLAWPCPSWGKTCNSGCTHSLFQDNIWKSYFDVHFSSTKIAFSPRITQISTDYFYSLQMDFSPRRTRSSTELFIELYIIVMSDEFCCLKNSKQSAIIQNSETKRHFLKKPKGFYFFAFTNGFSYISTQKQSFSEG